MRTGSFGKVLAAAVLPLALGGLPRTFSAHSSDVPGGVELVSYAPDDEGTDDPTDNWGLWMPRSRDASSGSSGGEYQSGRSREARSAAEPDYWQSVIDQIVAFARNPFGKGSGGSGSAEAGPFSDSPEYWRKIYYDQAMAAASRAGGGSEDPSRVFDNPSSAAPASTASGVVEPQSAPVTSSDSSQEVIVPPAASEPITSTQPDVTISPSPGRSRPTSGDDTDDPKPPKQSK